MKISRGKMMGLIIGCGLLILWGLGCAGPRYREKVEAQQQEIGRLKSENARLQADCTRLFSHNEVLLKKVNELQTSPRVGVPVEQAPRKPQAPQPELVGRLSKAGYTVLMRDGQPAVVVSGIFQSGRAALTSAGAKSLKKVGQIIAREAPQATLRIDGYTDNRGAPEANRQLSAARAKTVKDFLVQECGFKAGFITTRGRGELQPIGDNKTRLGRQKNRRIEIVILMK